MGGGAGFAGGAGTGASGSEGNCEGFCGDATLFIIATAFSVLAACGFLAYVCWKKKASVELQSRAVTCRSWDHPLNKTTAKELLASGDQNYKKSWICDMCNAMSVDIEASIFRCRTCSLDFCEKCLVKRRNDRLTA